MDGATVQTKVYAGLGKMARRIGFPCAQFRTDQLFAPTDPGYQIGTIYAAFSKTRLFHQPPDYKDSTELFWADGNQLQVRDILIHEEQGTFYVAWMPYNLPIEAVRCNTVLQIDRPESGTSEVTPIAAGIPAYMLNTRLEMKTPPGSYGAAAQPLSHWQVLLPLPEGTLKQYDTLTDHNGVRYVLNVPDFQRIGYVCEASLVL